MSIFRYITKLLKVVQYISIYPWFQFIHIQPFDHSDLNKKRASIILYFNNEITVK